MFMGEYHHSVDEKGRLIIPSKFRADGMNKFILTRGIEHCLYVYPLDVWEQITNKLESLAFTKKDAREFTRFFLSGATVAELDSQGRVKITSPQMSYANIEKECVIVGVGNRIEIWAVENWNSFMNSAFENMSETADNLFNESVII